MHFTVPTNQSEEQVWELILSKLEPKILKKVSSATSSFYRTADGIECSIRESNGSLIANGYSESDRMGNRRWSFNFESE